MPSSHTDDEPTEDRSTALGSAQRILVPVANETDAKTTCEAIERSFSTDTSLHTVHVIEKGGGAPDKAPLEARQEQAQAIFDFVTGSLESAGFEVTTEIRYGTDVIDEILAAAEETAADAIAFVPREGSRLTRFLTGNKTKSLIDSDRVPVIVLPNPDAQP
ncbi:universal stress protein [Natrononativus amylolyticus]|uniref:universal stress protein n=1 Tax=Natrononativus amylolyticus TaxID=2963434 RepID=UPI0020CCAECC|nr:universal stress protein [Natrononativus amylolyticus]